MPDEIHSYGTIITTQGTEDIADCILAGTKLRITEAAVGDGGGSYYEPNPDQAELRGEMWRGPIVSAEKSPTTPNMLDVKIVIDDDVGNFVAREIALYSEAKRMIAVGNIPDTEKVAISTGVTGRLTMLVHFVVVDSSVLEFVIVPALDTVSREDLDAAIAKHDTDPASHEDIRQAITDKVEEHNSSADVHPALQANLNGLDNRLAVLELKYGTNVTGNSFMVTFANLTGLIVTGVWNETYARVEF